MILGGASCIWDDVRGLEAIYGRPWDGLVVCANDIGSHWPGEFQHWVTLHANKFETWAQVRADNGLPPFTGTRWSQSIQRAFGVKRRIEPWPGGSSGMLAAQVAIEKLGCRRVVLCGIPISVTQHFKESKEDFRGKDWKAADKHWKSWPTEKHRMVGIVRSMSGRTRELLGYPSLEWLDA